MTPTSVADAYRSGNPNSIGFLRWVFASAVIVYHGYIIAAYTQDPIRRNLNLALGRTAVLCFFVLSGFLVARSYRSSSGFFDFLRKRVLRIYPGYWLALWVTILVLGPLSWIHSHGTYHNYKHSQPWLYFTQNWTLRVNYNVLPGTFSDTAAARKIHLVSANGSLWTLIYEFRCYLVVGVLGVAGILWARKSLVLLLTAFLGILVLTHDLLVSLQPDNKAAAAILGNVLQPLADDNLASLLFAFLVGTCMALHAERVVLDDRLGIASIAAVLLVARWHGNFDTLAIVPLCYAVLWLGTRLKMQRWDRIGDPSYGVYLYGWPVETLLAEYRVYPHVHIWLYIAASIIISTALGLISWHLVEKHATKLRSVEVMQLLTSAYATVRGVPAGRRPALGRGQTIPEPEPQPVPANA